MPEIWNVNQLGKALVAAMSRLSANLPKMNCPALGWADNKSVTSCANKLRIQTRCWQQGWCWGRSRAEHSQDTQHQNSQCSTGLHPALHGKCWACDLWCQLHLGQTPLSEQSCWHSLPRVWAFLQLWNQGSSTMMRGFPCLLTPWTLQSAGSCTHRTQLLQSTETYSQKGDPCFSKEMPVPHHWPSPCSTRPFPKGLHEQFVTPLCTARPAAHPFPTSQWQCWHRNTFWKTLNSPF